MANFAFVTPYSLALAGILATAPLASAQYASKVMTDAQVESNVLRALAAAPALATQSIKTTTVYGVVTLSGSVTSEELRTQAETLASRVSGVQKVVDELTLGVLDASASGTGASGVLDSSSTGSAVADAQPTNPNLQSDGTMAPSETTSAQADMPAGASPDMETQDNTGSPSGPNPTRTAAAPGTGQPPSGYPRQPYGPRPGYRQRPQPADAQHLYSGQQAGEAVTIPSGAIVRIRINQSLDSARTEPGSTFDGTVTNDVVAGGAVAIPRGAAVQGTVVDATRSGALTGRGELSLELTQVTLGGNTYRLQSDTWKHHGGDKTIESVNKTAVGSGIGALFGAAAGGGVGAAIGAGVGGAIGLGSSAASGHGQVYVPSEGILTFHLAAPTVVATVSQDEMNRLGQGIRSGAQPQELRRRAYPQVYLGPGYYGPVYYGPGRYGPEYYAPNYYGPVYYRPFPY